MARIAETELQHLKAAVSLAGVAQGQGRQLFKRGKDLVTLCPFHDEKTPSCVTTPAKNLYHCFGCDAGGSVLDWLMHTEKLSLRKAAERLRAELGENPAVTPLVKPDEPDVFTEDETGRQALLALLARVVDFYHHTLLNAPEAVAYLEKRRLNHPELVAQFRPGFANRTLGYRLPPKNRQAGAAIRSRLQAVGILRESGHEHFAGSLVVPVTDLHGQIGEIYGRRIGERPRAGAPVHLYLPGPHGGVWNEQALVAGKTVILCESLIDAMSFWVAGQRNVTAAYGVNGFTDDHRRAFAEHGVKQVLIAYDNDAAGNTAAVKLAAELAGMGMEAFRIVFPQDMDANGYLCRVAEPEAAFRLLAESAQPMREAVAETGAEPAATPTASSSVAGVAALSTPAGAATGSGAGTGSSSAASAVSEPGVVVERGAAGEVTVSLGSQQWRVRGLAGVKPGGGMMKVNAQLLDTESGVVFADGVDLMSARSRAGYARQAAVELGLAEGEVKRALGRVLLAVVQSMVKGLAAERQCKPGEVRFTRRDIRDFTQWSDNQLKVHCQRLAELEYLLVHGGSRGHLLQYELLWDGSGNGAHLCGLIDVPEEKQGEYDSGGLGSA
ncbi:CHC2 zinc finger domain-containing protein [Erwinia mallotivora]|uniref:CHC2 zinc finger domain-containing protein n=1 Tax=Erwinia mallotivora TaxID=69222 RepID=UPI0035E56EFA